MCTSEKNILEKHCVGAQSTHVFTLRSPMIVIDLVPTADIFTAAARRLNLSLFFGTGFTGGGLLGVGVILLGFLGELNISGGLLGQSRCLYQTGVIQWQSLFEVHGNLRSRLPRFVQGILVWYHPAGPWCSLPHLSWW